MSVLVRIVVNALALAVATWLLDGITLTGASVTERAVSLVLVAAVFGVVNAVVRPVVMLLSLPFIILTLGLLLLVINAVMLRLTGWLSGQLGLGFDVSGFGTAIVGALVITVVSWAVELLLPEDR